MYSLIFSNLTDLFIFHAPIKDEGQRELVRSFRMNRFVSEPVFRVKLCENLLGCAIPLKCSQDKAANKWFTKRFSSTN